MYPEVWSPRRTASRYLADIDGARVAKGAKCQWARPTLGCRRSTTRGSLASMEREAKQALTDSAFREAISTVTASGTTRVGVVLAAAPKAAILLRPFA